MRELEIITLKAKLNTVRQKSNMTIGEFKKNCDDHIEIITGAGVDPPPKPELAILFLTKLDPSRYAPMMAQLTNDATLGKPFPRTLHSAWTIASGWKGTNFRAHHGGEMHSVFTLADEDTRDARGRGRRRGRGNAANRQGPMPVTKRRQVQPRREHAKGALRRVTCTQIAPTTHTQDRLH